MLQPDVVHQLNMIANEGWEYHKLSPEAFDLFGPQNPGSGISEMRASFFDTQKESIWLDSPPTGEAANSGSTPLSFH